MIQWKVEATGGVNARGEIPTKWYAYDLIDDVKLSTQAMQEGLSFEKAMMIWQKKHWTLLKEKFLATEKMTFAEAKNIKSYDELKAWLEHRVSAEKKSEIIIPPEKPETGSGVITMNSEQEEVLDKVEAHLAEPIVPERVAKRGRPSGKGDLSKRIAEAVTKGLEVTA